MGSLNGGVDQMVVLFWSLAESPHAMSCSCAAWLVRGVAGPSGDARGVSVRSSPDLDRSGEGLFFYLRI